MRVLVNDAEVVKRGDSELWMVGTGDPAGAQRMVLGGEEAAPDLQKSLAKVPPGAFTLGLAHNPASWPHLAGRGARMTLSGHTHHGQLSIPFLNWCLATPFLGEIAMGAPRRGGAALCLSRLLADRPASAPAWDPDSTAARRPRRAGGVGACSGRVGARWA